VHQVADWAEVHRLHEREGLSVLWLRHQDDFGGARKLSTTAEN